MRRLIVMVVDDALADVVDADALLRGNATKRLWV